MTTEGLIHCHGTELQHTSRCYAAHRSSTSSLGFVGLREDRLPLGSTSCAR